MTQTTINNGDSGLTARSAINDNFTELYQSADVYVSSASASAAITATTYLNVLANATIADAGLTGSDWTVDDTNKRITYTGTATINRTVIISVSMISSKSNEVASFRLAKNGTTVASTQIDRKLGTGSDVGALAISGQMQFATNDYVELHATLESSSSNTITVNYANIGIR